MLLLGNLCLLFMWKNAVLTMECQAKLRKTLDFETVIVKLL